jgi:glycosyltransferase involved in cell wall biosynthesis
MAEIRLAYLVTHPIQYQAPLLRRLAREPGLDLTVFFCSDFSLQKFYDPEFDQEIEWDVPLVAGYRYEVLPAIGGRKEVSFWRPFNYGLSRRLKEENFDVIWVHGYARWFNWVAILLAKAQGLKVLIRDDATLISHSRTLIKKVFKRVFFLILNKFCDGFLAVGSLNRKYYSYYGIKNHKIFLMPWAVDNAFIQTKAQEASTTLEDLRFSLGFEKGRPIILFVGKLMEGKRVGDLLEAYIKLSPDQKNEPVPYLLIIGEGGLRQALENQARDTGWNSIKFLGFKNQTELPAYFKLCQVLVLPSIYESWGLVVNEMMNAGRAVIVSDQVGCGPDLVRNGENGFIFQTGDIAGLVQALIKVLENQERCRMMGQNSLKIIGEWSLEADVRGLKSALMSVLPDMDKKNL